MLTHNELKDIIESLPMTVDKDDRETTELIKKVAKQIGYSVPDCRCQDKWSDLSVKLHLWLRNHPEECHYTIRPGIVRRGPDGTNIYNLNLTDESAEWLLENDPEGARFITKIVDTETETKPKMETLEVQPEIVETKKKTTKKKKSQN